MNTWDEYPADYRAKEVEQILKAVCSGDCAAIVGLSGSGKSNLLGFLTHRLLTSVDCPRLLLVDCNRLVEVSPASFFRLVQRTLVRSLGEIPVSSSGQADELVRLEDGLSEWLKISPGICLVFDRFDVLAGCPPIFANLRALRDTYKYKLTYVTASRHPPDPNTELGELFFGHVFWLGPLSQANAFWSISHYAARSGLEWSSDEVNLIIQLSWGYPSLLRAICEAYAAGCPLNQDALRTHPAVQRRVTEFWMDKPTPAILRNAALFGQPLLGEGGWGDLPEEEPVNIGSGFLTAKEHLLMEYFLTHVGLVCEKDEIIQAVWPEDKIFSQGIRDDSLAQLVRRLRKKIETDPSVPQRIHTIPGRGYRFTT